MSLATACDLRFARIRSRSFPRRRETNRELKVGKRPSLPPAAAAALEAGLLGGALLFSRKMSGTDSDDGARLSSPTSKRARTDGRPVRATSGSATFAALSRACPLEHADPRNTECARQLREAEKYEIAAQGDDYADSDLKSTNTEALAYAKAAATVLSMDVRLSEWTENLAGLKRALRREPFLGDFRTAQICEFVSSGSFEALRSFERNEPPIGSDGQRRIVNSARRSMHGAAAKREMGSVLGIGWRTAYQLYEGEHPNLPKVRSLAELKALRANMVHKPRDASVLKKKPFALKAPPQRTTLAESPALSTKMRSAVRA